MKLGTGDRLSRRELNRATLERQLLLRRSPLTPEEAVTRLVGLQAQEPPDPYTALWARLDGFRPEALSELLAERRVVRIALMRSTIHLVTAEDAFVLRPLVQPVLDRELMAHSEFAPALRGIDLREVTAFAARVLAEPRTVPELRAALAERFPDCDPAALAYACRNHLALVQAPPRGTWRASGRVRLVTAEAWLGRPSSTGQSLADTVLRYLSAFGPALTADITAWSRLTGLREVVDRLRPRLRVLRDEQGRELFDHPDAPRPDPDIPAPVRFLPEYDNVLLSHADRGRFLTPERRALLGTVPGRVHGSVLVDGEVCAVWRLEGDRRKAIDALVVTHVVRLSKRTAASVEAEGRRLLRFLGPEAGDAVVRLVHA